MEKSESKAEKKEDVADDQTDEEREIALERCATAIARARHVMVFTGAGLSAESGIQTFRGQGSGLWSGFTGWLRMMYGGTPIGWKLTPGLTWKGFVRHFYAEIARAKPNPAHVAIAQLGRIMPLTIVTQNVDGLHQKAGSPEDTVNEVHGTVMRFRCSRNSHIAHPNPECLVPGGPAPVCTEPGCKSAVRPDCTLFGEELSSKAWSNANRVTACMSSQDVMLVVGTSGVVFPAASLPGRAMHNGAVIIDVNPYPTQIEHTPGYLVRGFAGIMLPKLVQRVAEKLGKPLPDASLLVESPNTEKAAAEAEGAVKEEKMEGKEAKANPEKGGVSEEKREEENDGGSSASKPAGDQAASLSASFPKVESKL